MAVGLVCAETERKARNDAAQAAARYMKGAGDHGGLKADADDNKLSAYVQQSEAAGERWLVGTARQIAGRMQALRARYGVDEFMMVPMAATYRKRLRACRLLADELAGR